MTFKQFLRAVERGQRQAQREHNRRAREHARAQKELARQFRDAQKRQAAAEKEHARAMAQADVASFAAYLESLISFHKYSLDPIDWHSLERSAPPSAPRPTATHEHNARVALAQYSPGLVDKMFGGAKKRRAELELAVVEAQVLDRQATAAAHAQYEQGYAEWQANQHLAARMNRRDGVAFRELLEAWNPASALEPYAIAAALQSVDSDVAVYTAALDPDTSVPTEELKLTAGGKLSRKTFPVSKRWDLCQDYVCSAGLRLAADTFALVPVSRVIVNLGGRELNTATGHMENVCWVAAHITRDAFYRIRLEGIDPSDAMANFQVRMKFRKTKGFARVDPITRDDQWVTT